MKLVNDKIYLNTLTNTKKFIEIASSPKNYTKKILINLMPTFAFKQLIVFIKLGEYLKKEGFWVDYLICNGEFKHCDMVKMNDLVDRKLICERCIYANNILNIPSIELNIDDIQTEDYEIYLKNSIKRFCGDDIKFKLYEKECQYNLNFSSNLKLEEYDFFITLNHFENYSIAPLYERFENSLLINLINKDNFMINGANRNKMCKYKFDFNNILLEKVENYLKKRIVITKKLTFSTKKKIAVLFPNVLEDAFEKESNVIFNTLDEWLKESVDFLLKNNFFVIIKAHPSEAKWKPFKKVIDLFVENENLKLLSSDVNINTYDLMEIADYIITYNGTVFYESLVMDKKVVLAGKLCDIYHSSKEEYFNQFINYKPYNYNKAMKYAYIILFTKFVKLNMVDLSLPYPHIKNSEKEVAFEIVKDIINDDYVINKYIDKFVPLY